MKIYITGSASVLSTDSRVEFSPTGDYVGLYNINYSDYIKPALIRRMSKVIRMAVSSAKIALEKANTSMPEAIIVGTGLGCLTDTKRFLSDLCTSKEGVISPTAFIQSTHNTIAGQIALLINCNGYNSTYSDRNHSFEQALQDAKLHLIEGNDSVLVGAADEDIDMIEKVVNSIAESHKPLVAPKGFFLGEGSSFFVVSRIKKPGSITLEALKLFPRISKLELRAETLNFLSENDLNPGDIDVAILGDWPSSGDHYYEVIEELFEKTTPMVYYKKQSGQYFTSSAYALDTACSILINQTIPKSMLPTSDTPGEIRNILIYNNYKGAKHSFYLISK